ncbi:MAG: sulfotransferase, partial [Bacteroidota bacterium]|nr:sulfotransferase [Bacteroidota bacterium]
QAPEEDILLLDTAFLSTTPEATMHVPSYASWLETTDQSSAYAYMIKLLKFLQWQRPAKRWILKSPHHMEFLDIADKNFENISFLWTHRDVKHSVPSFLSMVSHSRVIFSDKVNNQTVAKHWVRKTAYMLEKGVRFRNANSNQRDFKDIFYDDFINNPMEILGNIYQDYGGINEELSSRLIHANEVNPQGKYGIHEYALSDFGLAHNDILLTTSSYHELLKNIKRI